MKLMLKVKDYDEYYNDDFDWSKSLYAKGSFRPTALKRKDLKIDVFRDSSPNPMYLVRMTYLPRNIVVESDEGRPEIKCRQQALQELEMKVFCGHRHAILH